MDINQQKTMKEFGCALNWIVIGIGVCLILLGVVAQLAWEWSNILYTILYSVGASVLASGIVLIIQSRYLTATHDLDQWLSIWKVRDLYETKSDMNTKAANEALKNCSKAIDIIAEGMSGYRDVHESVLREKYLRV